MLQSDVQVSEIPFLARVFRRTESPAYREKNREFRRFSRFLPKSVSKTSAESAVCKLSSCATEQGINSRQQGSNSTLSGRNRELSAKSTRAPMKHLFRVRHFAALSPTITDRLSPGRSAAVAVARRAGRCRGEIVEVGAPWRARSGISPVYARRTVDQARSRVARGFRRRRPRSERPRARRPDGTGAQPAISHAARRTGPTIPDPNR
jgi:hypothetical protein